MEPDELPEQVGRLPAPSRRLRPTTAAGKLQTHKSFYSPLYDRPKSSLLRTAAAAARGRPTTSRPDMRLARKAGEDEVPDSDDLNIQTARRLTLDVAEGVADKQEVKDQRHLFAAAMAGHQERMEEVFTLELLRDLKREFFRGGGAGRLTQAAFQEFMRHRLKLNGVKEQQVGKLFNKIDWSSEGQLSWGEFCTYMQLQYSQKEELQMKEKEVHMITPARSRLTPHRDAIEKIVASEDGTFIAFSKDGFVSFWSPQLKLHKQRALAGLLEKGQKPKWYTDLVILSEVNKLAVSTGDREIQFYEISNLEPYCQLASLPQAVISFVCHTEGEKTFLCWGDTIGAVHVLELNDFADFLRMWKKCPKMNGLPTTSFSEVLQHTSRSRYVCWTAHSDWVVQLLYCPITRLLFSASADSNASLVVGCLFATTDVSEQMSRQGNRPKAAASLMPRNRPECEQSVFKVHKGVKSFVLSRRWNVVVTGGMDRHIRFWNPYVCKRPVCLLSGHGAPIISVALAEEEGRVFSLSQDKFLKVWDVEEQTCLITISPKQHKITGDVQAACYSPVARSLCVTTDRISIIPVIVKPVLQVSVTVSHKEPITCVLYNLEFSQLVTASEGSIVRVWDMDTGALVFEFGEAHGDMAVNCMSFDDTGRRLITGGQDGAIRIWNYNNGQCIKTMKRNESAREVASVAYVDLNRNKQVLAVGWDRHINIFTDNAGDRVKNLQFATEQWDDDTHENGHTEDIIAMAQCKPNLLATAGYDGAVLVWNMVSGHKLAHLMPPRPEAHKHANLDGDNSVRAMVFFPSRAYSKSGVQLITSGPYGHIHFWNVYGGGRLLAQINAMQVFRDDCVYASCRLSGGAVTAMVLSEDETNLFTSDNYGFINRWNVADFAVNGPEDRPLDLVCGWRAHVEAVSSMCAVSQHRLLVTVSHDCCARVWTDTGDFVGTFGQPAPWELHNTTTYKAPMVPYDVLIDPLSLPPKPVVEEKDADANDQQRAAPKQTWKGSDASKMLSDDDIAALVTRAPTGRGKRLRYQQLKLIPGERLGPDEYQHLHIYNLAPPPSVAKPETVGKSRGQFDFFDD